MKYLLAPFSWMYSVIVLCRNKAFDWGLLNTEKVAAPVISVGNLTMGGTGKTPLVEYIVRLCLEKGRKVAVVSRGYGRESEGIVVVSDGQRMQADAFQGGDEPVQVARKFPGVVVIVGEKRVDAARKAVGEFGANAIVVDDGFQHRYLHRDLDILVLDVRKDLFHIPMIPAGERREPMSSLRRADVFAFSRADASPGSSDWVALEREGTRVPKFLYRYKLDYVRKHGVAETYSAQDLKGKRFFVFSGIGDHRSFVEHMKNEVMEVVGDLGFRDHHQYSIADLRSIASQARRSDAHAFLTTEKDMARLTGGKLLVHELTQSLPLFYAGIVVDVLSGKAILGGMLDNCLTKTYS